MKTLNFSLWKTASIKSALPITRPIICSLPNYSKSSSSNEHWIFLVSIPQFSSCRTFLLSICQFSSCWTFLLSICQFSSSELFSWKLWTTSTLPCTILRIVAFFPCTTSGLSSTTCISTSFRTVCSWQNCLRRAR